MGEKRKFRRYLEKTRAVINCFARAGTLHESDYFVSTHDISMGGARLVSSHYFPVGTDLIVSLDLSTVDRFAQLWGKVMWVEKRQNMGLYDLGIEFNHTSDPVREITERFRRS